MQDSVWITPYNPIDTLRLFIEERKLLGTVIISDLGKNGSIGEENILSLMIRIYHLGELNERYNKWINHTYTSVHERILSYLSILKDDPQLPFALLPAWWKGDTTYQSIQHDIQKLSTLLRSDAG